MLPRVDHRHLQMPAEVCAAVVHLNLLISVRAFSESGPSEWAPAAEFVTPPKARRKV
jgi:hypothetical protein